MLHMIWNDNDGLPPDVCVSPDVSRIQEELQAVVKLPLRTYNDTAKCVTDLWYDLPITQKNILILHVDVADTILSEVHHMCNVVCVFVYLTGSEIPNEQVVHCLEKYKKVVMVELNNIVEHVILFNERWLRNSNESFSFCVAHGFNMERSVTSINDDFIFSQLLLNVLLRMKSLPTDRADFCAQYIKVYGRRFETSEEANMLENALEQLHIFQRSVHDDEAILKWYTKNHFLHGLLNESFRTDDIETIFQSRFIIKDLYEKLVQRQCVSSIRVYRAQRMLDTEATRLAESIGQLVCMKSFLSTSLSRTVAESYFDGTPDSNTSGNTFVMFIIDAYPSDTNKMLRPFANIADNSQYTNEEEILFMIGSVFRIINVAQDFRRRWIISMTMSDREDRELYELFSWLKDQEDTNGIDYDPFYEFGNLLLGMDMPYETEKFCHYLLHEYELYSPKNEGFAKCYHMLGKAVLNHTLHKPESELLADRLELSLQYFKQALSYIVKTAPLNYFFAGNIYHSTANAYRAMKNYKNASSYYEKALKYYKKTAGKIHRLIAELYADFGRMYHEQKKMRKALDYHMRALNVVQQILPDTHPEAAVFHTSIAVIYCEMGNQDQAQLHFEAAANIDLSSYPNKNPPLSSYYGVLHILYSHKTSIHRTPTTQPPIVERNRSHRVGIIYYRCPWCHLYVWIYKPFAFCKGSACFECLRKLVTIRSSHVNSRLIQHLNYFIAYDRRMEQGEFPYLFARNLRRDYLGSRIDEDLNELN